MELLSDISIRKSIGSTHIRGSIVGGEEIRSIAVNMSLKQNASQCTIPKTSDNIYLNEAVEIKRVNMKDDRYTEKYKKLTNKQSSGTKQTTIDAQARDWFRSLSAEERSGATRFSDRAFLGTFLALSSPWLTSTTTKATGTTTNTTNDNHVTRSGEYIFLCTFYVIYPGILFST